MVMYEQALGDGFLNFIRSTKSGRVVHASNLSLSEKDNLVTYHFIFFTFSHQSTVSHSIRFQRSKAEAEAEVDVESIAKNAG